ncbi:MAG: hypothetical protein MZV65_16205 [Chromatiales bacterium]|nr:hypothetical protein [Chromatiales bacterium]
MRYYIDAGAGGIAAGVHTTQFEIPGPRARSLPTGAVRGIRGDRRVVRPPWTRGAEGGRSLRTRPPRPWQEADFLVSAGYHAGLLSLAGHGKDSNEELLAHVRKVAGIDPRHRLLPPARGGRPGPALRVLAGPLRDRERRSPSRWHPSTATGPSTWCAPWRSPAGPDEIALYTGNDDNIVVDLLTEYAVRTPAGSARLRIAGGLLGHWSVWTRRAVELLRSARDLSDAGAPMPQSLLTLAQEVTDANAAVFDAANGFAGCIPGIHEVLRRQGLLAGTWCLNPQEVLSPGQAEEIDRVRRSYPHLTDDEFVDAHLRGVVWSTSRRTQDHQRGESRRIRMGHAMGQDFATEPDGQTSELHSGP